MAEEGPVSSYFCPINATNCRSGQEAIVQVRATIGSCQHGKRVLGAAQYYSGNMQVHVIDTDRHVSFVVTSSLPNPNATAILLD